MKKIIRKLFKRASKSEGTARTKPKLKRWQLILMLIVCLSLGSIIIWQKANAYIYLLAEKTPIPAAPKHEGIQEDEVLSRTEQYQQQLVKGKQEAQAIRKRQDRQQRIRIQWEQIYQQQAKNQQDSIRPEPPIEEPRQRTRRAYAKATYQAPRQPHKPKEIAVEPVSFNLQKHEQHGLVQHTQYRNSQTVDLSHQKAIKKGTFIRAIIDGNQDLLPEEAVKLQLLQTIQWKGQQIPAHTRLTGTCQFQGGRLHIKGQQVVVNGNVLPIRFTAYDQQHIPGLAYHDPRLKRQLQQQLSRDVSQTIPSTLHTGIGIVDQMSHSLSGVTKDIIRNTGKGSRSFSLPDNYHLFLNIE